MGSDTATTALTGQLPFIVIAGAVIAFPLSIFLLKRYTAAVLKHMAARGGATPVAPEAFDATHPGVAEGQLEVVVLDASSASGTSDDAAYRYLVRAPWETVRVYAMGGAAYAAILALAQLIADGNFSPLRFIAMMYIYAWPVVIAINLILPSTRSLKLRSAGFYFGGLLLISIVAVSVSTDLSLFALFLAWALFSVPATVLVMAFLHRRVRAVGVMVLSFTVISVAGANVALAIAGASDSFLRSIAGFAIAIGSNAVGAFIAIILIGAVIFGVIAWFANSWIKKLYLEKRLSDQSMILDGMWFIFAAVQSIGLAFVSPGWYTAGLVAFLAYKFTVIARFRSLRSKSESNRPSSNLLFLRVFSLGRRSEQVFDAVSAHWRYIGNVRMIAGPDLAVTTVEPHEFLEYLSGKIDQSFVGSAEALDERIATLDAEADFDGRYRVNDFFCYDDTWKMVLSRLVSESDAVLMDVRGFSASNTGVVYELNELINVVPLEKIVLVKDRSTDTVFLNETLDQSWAGMRADSPNRNASTAQLKICEVERERAMEVPHVLRQLGIAAT